MPADHSHGHTHHHGSPDFGQAFAVGIGLNVSYVAAEAFWGIAVHSMALLADAAHNLGDVAALAGAWFAAWLGRRVPSAQYTYGLRRSSIIAALGNAITLLIVTGGIAAEAIRRLIAPEPTAGLTVLIVSVVGVAVNGGTAWLFLAGRKSDLNVRAAFAHMAADAALSLGVAIAGATIMLTGWIRLDPAVSLAISVVIVVTTWSLLRDSVNLSLDAVPPGIERAAVAEWLGALPGVSEVHDLHIWGMSTTETALTAHLVREDAANDAELLDRITHEADTRFGIAHVTIQLETHAVAARCELRPDHVV